jgi:dihydrofolate synthase / folylpolyglutamate synthase
MTAAPLGYEQAVQALQSRGRFGISLGLERIDALLAELGHPERSLHGALVAGTNGKGSVVALARSALSAAGLRTGTMPKPHLVSYRERIAINGVSLEPERFAAAVAAVLPAVDRVQSRLGAPTEFEVLTAAAFSELARVEVDLALVEVGMGGRLDATNALDAGVAAITNVQHDHERHLGKTLAEIGAEKAGIIKPGNLVVTGATGRGLRPILDRCARLGLSPRRAGPGQAYRAEVRETGWQGLLLDLVTPERELHDVRVGLLGSHQAANAAVALALLDALQEDGRRRAAPLPLDEDAIRRGFVTARWPGRLELLRDTPYGDVLLDGAHNPAGARALARALDELGVHNFPLVLGAMRGKRVTAILRALAPLRPRPVFTRVSDPGGVEPATLLRTWRRLAAGGMQTPSPPAALARAAEQRTDPGQPVVVAGSLYLVGAIRGMLTGEEAAG